MTDASHVTHFIGLFVAGLGMLLIGGLNLALARTRVRVRVLASCAVAAGAVGAFAAWDSNPAAVRRVAWVLAVAVGPAVLLGSTRVIAAGAALVRLAGHPAARWGLLAGAGVATVLVGTMNFTRLEESAHDRDLSELEMLVARPPLADVERTGPRTDRGYAVTLQRAVNERNQPEVTGREEQVLTKLGYKDVLIRRGPATDQSNCHGWVFTGGRHWVTGETVPQILDDNGYAAVTDPRPGDLVVYRTEDGAVGHTAVVRYVTDGMPPIVEGKWAWMGVFLHPVDQSVYGTNVTYYRSPRPGHLIAGLE